MLCSGSSCAICLQSRREVCPLTIAGAADCSTAAVGRSASPLERMITTRDISIVYACVAAGLFVLRLFPGSLLTRFAFTWFGPAPKPGELKSHYWWRWALYAFVWFCQIVAVVLAGAYFVACHPGLADNLTLQGIWFALSLLGLMAAGGLLLSGLSALKARLFGPNPRFTDQTVNMRSNKRWSGRDA